MAQLSIMQVYETWIQVGGNTGSIATVMTAIAMAESGGDSNIVSPSYDYGVWQINIVHAQQFPRLWRRWSDPLANARMAKAISGNGTNIGPWCTIWVDPATYCGHYHAPPPQAGTPAASWLPKVAAAVGGQHVTPEHPAGGFEHPGEAPWGHWQQLLGDGATGRHNDLHRARQIMRRI